MLFEGVFGLKLREIDFELVLHRLLRPPGYQELAPLAASRFAGNYCNFAYSALACLRTRMSESASFQSVRKSLYAARALTVSPESS